MLFRRERKRVPLLNTTSTADISFMLLIFFLVTTSMDIDKGLSRQLPPANPTEELLQPTDVREGVVLKLHIEKDNTLVCDGAVLPINQLHQRVISHVNRVGKEHILQLQADRNASYDAYFQVQNEIVGAYKVLREEKARSQFGHSFARCTEEQQRILRDEIPQRVSEVYLSEEGGQP
ncbi:MAG: biopolymer transporter ExbD [Prevotella sp.]|nr:biopolymer transporter ExbD [Prevotella sp.]